MHGAETGYAHLIQHLSRNGKFVAVFKGKVVDYDTDKRTLAKRVYAKYGYVPIYIDKVSEEKRVVEVSMGKRMEPCSCSCPTYIRV